MDIIAFLKNQDNDCSERILWGAFQYALSSRDGKTTEAVIATLEASIGTLGDGMLKDMQTAIEQYIKDGFLFAPEAKFLPEWTEVLGWIAAERAARAEDGDES